MVSQPSICSIYHIDVLVQAAPMGFQPRCVTSLLVPGAVFISGPCHESLRIDPRYRHNPVVDPFYSQTEIDSELTVNPLFTT